MLDYITYFTILIIAILAVLYIRKQIALSQNIRIEDTTLEKLDEKLKKHKLIGGRHKRTNKKNPPIV
jgi:biopolymer transport protein ExbB/TolQ